MRLRILGIAVPAFALAACNSGSGAVANVEVEDPSDPAQIAAALENLPQPQAGEYRVSGDLTEFEAEGATEEEAQFARSMFETMFAAEQTVCRTEEEAANAYRQLVDSLTQGSDDCAYSRYAVNGDVIDATMQCDDGEGSKGTFDFDATVTETTQNITLAMDMANQDQAVRMTLSVNMQRVGECSQAQGEDSGG